MPPTRFWGWPQRASRMVGTVLRRFMTLSGERVASPGNAKGAPRGAPFELGWALVLRVDRVDADDLVRRHARDGGVARAGEEAGEHRRRAVRGARAGVRPGRAV